MKLLKGKQLSLETIFPVEYSIGNNLIIISDGNEVNSIKSGRPHIISNLYQVKQIDKIFFIDLEIINFPEQVTVNNLPSGLSFIEEDLRIVGSVNSSGEYNISITASNIYGQDEKTLKLLIVPKLINNISSYFPNINSSVVVNGDTSAYKFTPEQSFSISAWCKLDNVNNDFRTIISKYDSTISSLAGWRLFINDHIIFINNDDLGNSVFFISDIILSVNTWYSIIVTCSNSLENGKGYSLYVNGVKQNIFYVRNDTLWGQGTNKNMIIGNTESFDDGFRGYIDEITIWNKELSEQDVTSLFNNYEIFNYSSYSYYLDNLIGWFSPNTSGVSNISTGVNFLYSGGAIFSNLVPEDEL